jgi:hypothetical protein
MAQPGSPISTAPPAQRPNRRRLWIALGILGGVLYVAFQAVSGAAALYLASPALFQRNQTPAAPSGWHSVTPAGQVTNPSYAVSADAPGLILACGATLSSSLVSFGKRNLRLQRSDDGGAHWRTLQAPFLKDNDKCAVTPISGSPTTFFAYGRQLLSNTPATFWVTHDSGETWAQAFTTENDYDEYSVMSQLSASVLRDGVFYSLQGDSYDPTFSSSTDDGATWIPVLKTTTSGIPSGRIASFAADYSQPRAWYQSVYLSLGGLAIEHSSDDGKTWTIIKQFAEGAGAAPTELATASAQPKQLCAYATYGESNATLFSSADGGATWGQASLPVGRGSIQGMAHLSSDGCYLAFQDDTKGGAFGSSHDIEIWCLLDGATNPERLAYLKNYSFDFLSDTLGFTYLPASDRMEARLVIAATREPRSWVDFFGGNASNLNTLQLLWTPAP